MAVVENVSLRDPQHQIRIRYYSHFYFLPPYVRTGSTSCFIPVRLHGLLERDFDFRVSHNPKRLPHSSRFSTSGNRCCRSRLVWFDGIRTLHAAEVPTLQKAQGWGSFFGMVPTRSTSERGPICRNDRLGEPDLLRP